MMLEGKNYDIVSLDMDRGFQIRSIKMKRGWCYDLETTSGRHVARGASIRECMEFSNGLISVNGRIQRAQ